MEKKPAQFFEVRLQTTRDFIATKVGALSFSGLITIISGLMVVNIYLLLYSEQLTGVGDGSLYKDLIYAESAISFISLVCLGLWFRILRTRLFSLVDASRDMISTGSSSAALIADAKRSREGIFVEMRELAAHMRSLHERMTYFAALSGAISTMLDSLGQGILVISQDGKCSQFYSKACEDLFERSPAGVPVADLLAVPAQEREAFDSWLEILFAESIAFEDLADLAPKIFRGTKGKQIMLEMKPVRNSDQKIEGVLLIATDKTREYEADLKARENRDKAEMILKISQEKELFRTLLKTSRDLVSWLRNSIPEKMGPDFLGTFKRAVHTVKGSAGSFYMTALFGICHELETDLRVAESMPSDRLVQRCQKFILDVEMELSDVLLRHSSVLGQRFESDGPVRVLPLITLIEYHDLMERSSALQLPDLREQFFVDFICVPIREAFSSFDTRLQDLAQKLGKKVEGMKFSGLNLRVSKESNGSMLFNLSHIFNNVVDHGIEFPEERRAAGKPAAGRVTTDVQIVADQQGIEWVEITISDDGRGVNAAKIREKLERLGKTSAGETDLEVIQHIFDADFSTRDEVSDLSGRGVGLNALKTAVLERNGQVAVFPSRPYGTKFVIRIPRVILCGMTGKNFEKIRSAA